MRLRAFLVGAALAAASIALPAPSAAAAAPAGHRATVSSPIGLNVRSGPAQRYKVLSRLPNRKTATVSCQVTGQLIVGTQRTTSRWAKLSAGGYVSDAFLAWSTSRDKVPNCADGGVPTARVIGGIALNVRTGAGTNHSVIGRLAPGTKVRATCRVWGQRIEGDPVWYRIGKGRYVSARFVRWTPRQPQLPWCGQAPSDTPATSTAAFIARTAPPAQASMRRYKVPAAVTIAQAILESGWGRSALAAKDHNYFGMKCFGGPGAIAIGCRTYATRECDGSRCFTVRDSFRVYRSAADSFADHGKQLATLARYKTAMRYAKDPNRFATEIHKAGYATSPAYAKSLIAIMKQYRLYRYGPAATG